MIDDRTFVAAAQKALRSLYRMSLSMLHSQADAQDAVQQGMLRAWERRAQIRDNTKLDAWFRRIVINECRNIQRKRMRVFPVDEPLEDMQGGCSQEKEDIWEAMDTLPENLRMPLLLKYMDGFSENEIAHKLGVPRTTVKSRLYRARKALAIALLLIIIAATALAAYFVVNGFYADVAQLHVNAGAYDNWTLEEKEGLLASMKAHGVLDDSSEWDDALTIRNDTRREAALDALFAARYGINGRTDVITAQGIIDHEMGMYDGAWSLEEKAAYSQMMLEIGLYGYDEMIDMLPEEGDISQEEAVRIAKKAVITAYALEEEALSNYEINVFFQVHRMDAGVKEPYYMIEMLCVGKTPYWVYVSGDGRVLDESDGYRGIVSPSEEAARIAAEEEVKTVPETTRFAEHVAGLQMLDTQIYTREGRIADGAEGLSGGLAVVYGRMSSAYTVYDGAFVECIDGHNDTKWLLEWPDENGEALCVEAVMELGEDLLVILRRQKNGKQRQAIDYICYDQLRIGMDGTVKERKQMKTISELTGMRNGHYEQMFAQAGHGGMLVSGYMGGKHVPVYVQLDENGEACFILSFEELLGYAPYLKTTDEGYVLCAWNQAAERTILRYYDKQGQFVQEGSVPDIRVNQLKSAESGELIAASNFMKNGEWTLARIDAEGSLLDMQIYRDESGPILRPTQIVQINGHYVYACDHHLSESDWTNHTAVIISDSSGVIREYSMQGADDFSDRIGYLHLAPVGEGKVMIVYTTMNGMEKLTAQLAVLRIPK